MRTRNTMFSRGRGREYPDLVTMLKGTSCRYRKKTAIIFGAKKISYAQLDELSDKAAAAFRRLGVKSKDKVALWLHNCPEFVYSYFGILKLGAVVVPINSMFKREEAKFIIENSESCLIVCSVDKIDHARVVLSRVESLRHIVCVPCCNHGKEEKVADFNSLIQNEEALSVSVEVSPDDTAQIIYTSGTTGLPKGA